MKKPNPMPLTPTAVPVVWCRRCGRAVDPTHSCPPKIKDGWRCGWCGEIDVNTDHVVKCRSSILNNSKSSLRSMIRELEGDYELTTLEISVIITVPSTKPIQEILHNIAKAIDPIYEINNIEESP